MLELNCYLCLEQICKGGLKTQKSEVDLILWGSGEGGSAPRWPSVLSGRFFVNLPQLLLDLGGQGVEEVLLHHQARPLQLPALAQLHRQAFQAVSSQLQLRQPRQLPEAGRQRLQAIVSQVQSAELLALEQLVWQALNLFEAGKRMETNRKAFILRCFKKRFQLNGINHEMNSPCWLSQRGNEDSAESLHLWV